MRNHWQGRAWPGKCRCDPLPHPPSAIRHPLYAIQPALSLTVSVCPHR
ncbi:hypothetical protein EDWATA_01681 [Edwardsiella tarda ATCC 23685]|uniref:Uncharacterized protein n=1 Tax=Edwardsiella tarda ATCC 23685 TaxID=500638 RepID=D4F4K8_EDWTA|nr:hypothetical protein EDWATA_01681 [Edwardsiella tarda ATCC 23685]